MLQAIQRLHSPILDSFFGIVTNLHHEMVYIVVLPLVYWLYDKKLGRYLFSVFALGFWTNDILKSLLVMSRPDPAQLRVLFSETTHDTPGFPSGHSQTPLVFWGAMAWQLRRRWVTWSAAILVFLIGFSRLYAGLHWPYDVLGGWAIGFVVLAGIHLTYRFWAGEGQPLKTQLLWSVLLPALALGITALVKPIDGLTMTVVGAYAGLMVGSALEDALVGFNPRRGGLLAQVLKVVVGLALALAVKEGFKLFLPKTGAGDFIRYFCVAIVATLVAPFLFQRFVSAPPASKTITRGQ